VVRKRISVWLLNGFGAFCDKVSPSMKPSCCRHRYSLRPCRTDLVEKDEHVAVIDRAVAVEVEARGITTDVIHEEKKIGQSAG
jgi:hypothetical protein